MGPGKQYALSVFRIVTAVALLCHANTVLLAAPAITGSPSIERPRLLGWPRDVVPVKKPDLTERTANRVYDLHGSIDDCDLVFSTAGNYHMALRDLWYDVFLPVYASGLNLKNWFYTTSPPISPDQIANAHVSIGNFRSGCKPQVAVGPLSLMSELYTLGFTKGDHEAIIQNRGNVILVKAGNPKLISSVWDLGRDDVRVVTSNPKREPGSFGNYSNSIYNIAYNDPYPPTGWDADRLFNAIFNNTWVTNKWLSGRRIHHREVPYSVSLKRADAGLMFYHLALHARNTFPSRFDIVPLGGSVAAPNPLPGNRVGVLYAVRIVGNWNAKQLDAQVRLIQALKSPDFTGILHTYGLDRPSP